MIPIARPMIGNEEISAVEGVMRSLALAQGEEVRKFEEEFASYCGTKHAVATSSGTTALQLALMSSGVQGGEVITTSFSFIATANTIVLAQAKPVFADSGEDYNVMPERIREAITPKTKAIMPVHLYGQPCAMREINEIVESRDIAVIEDACQAHGAGCDGKKAGSLGTAGCFSFYPTKNMTCGEGGMITTDDAQLAEKARMLREHGARKRYFHEILGFNFRMTNIHAAIGRVQLGKLEGFNEKRRKNAEYFSKNIRNPLARLPFENPGTRHAYHQYTLAVGDGRRDCMKAWLEQKGIGSAVHYPTPIHLQPVYKNDAGGRAKLPNSERAAAEVLSIPVHPALEKEELERIVEAVNGFR